MTKDAERSTKASVAASRSSENSVHAKFNFGELTF
jgi:hypothetical protein